MDSNNTAPAPLLSAALSRRPARREIAIALGIPTALFLAVSIAWLVRTGGMVKVSDASMARTIGAEVLLALLIVPYLAKRGWNPRAIAGSPTPFDVLLGLGVFLASYLAIYIVVLGLYLAAPAAVETVRSHRVTGVVSPVTAMTVAIINPVFEEFLWLGYAIPAVGARYGLPIAVATSVVLRVAVHAYQGPLAVVSILPVAIVYTWYFVRTGRLWPLIVAHVLVDALGLALLSPTR